MVRKGRRRTPPTLRSPTRVRHGLTKTRNLRNFAVTFAEDKGLAIVEALAGKVRAPVITVANWVIGRTVVLIQNVPRALHAAELIS